MQRRLDHMTKWGVVILWTASIIFLVFLIAIVPNAHGSEDHEPPGRERKLMMILFDAFRWDYVDMPGLTGFPRLFETGVRTEYLRSEFPTVSWPNHYTLTTGLHVESHGMVNNEMYDPVTKKMFSFYGKDRAEYENPYWWNGGEPIWITATRQNKTAYMYYWLGCEVEIRGLRPAFFVPYPADPGPSLQLFTQKMDEALDKLKSDSADLAGLYLDVVDDAGHHHGPFSKEVNDTIRGVDQIINHLLDQVIAKNLTHILDVVMFSDHGMITKNENRAVPLGKVFSEAEWRESVMIAQQGCAQMEIWPAKGKEKFVYERLKNSSLPYMRVFKKDDINKEKYWHYQNNKRTPPIELVADPGGCILKPTDTFTHGGTHGYDNKAENMRGVFMAFGPHFKKGKVFPAIPNVDIYQIMCKVLGIKPSPHNGTWGHVVDMLIDEDSEGAGLLQFFTLVFFIFLLIL